MNLKMNLKINILVLIYDTSNYKTNDSNVCY